MDYSGLISTVIPAKAGIQERWGWVFWMPDQVRHDTIVGFNQPR